MRKRVRRSEKRKITERKSCLFAEVLLWWVCWESPVYGVFHQRHVGRCEEGWGSSFPLLPRTTLLHPSMPPNIKPLKHTAFLYYFYSVIVTSWFTGAVNFYEHYRIEFYQIASRWWWGFWKIVIFLEYFSIWKRKIIIYFFTFLELNKFWDLKSYKNTTRNT